MESTIDVKVGQVVRSKSGRDKGEVFLIFQVVDNSNVTIVNGKSRKLANPKLKNIKHLYIYKDVLELSATNEDKYYQFDDAYLRRILKPYSEVVDKQEV